MSHSKMLEKKLRIMKEERNYLECSIKCYSKRLISSFNALQVLNEKNSSFMEQNRIFVGKEGTVSSFDDTFINLDSEMLPKLIKLLEYEILRHVLLEGIQRLQSKSIQIEERMRNMNTMSAPHRYDCETLDGQPMVFTGLKCCLEKNCKSLQPEIDRSKFPMEIDELVDILEKLKHHVNELDSELSSLREDAADWEQRLIIARMKVASVQDISANSK